MMLRSKSKNGQLQPVDQPQKRKNNSILKLKNEPAAKRSIGDMIKAFSIDSTKRKNLEKENKERKETERFENKIVDPCPNYDFDVEESQNPDSVSEYAQEIFLYYKSREKYFHVIDYLPKHSEIDDKTRAILVDWLVELQETFELNHETLYNSVKIVDLYLAKTENVKRNDIQKIASAAIFIAAKYDERSPPLADDLIYLSGDRFDRNSLMETERNLFAAIDFDLGAPLSYRYLRRLARVTRCDMESLTLARYLLETSLLIYQYSLIASSRVACAAYLLAMKMKDKKYEWNPILTKYSGYTEDEIVPLMEHLNHTMHFVTSKWKQLNNIREKYSHEVFYKSALVPFLPDTLSQYKGIPDLSTMSFP